MSKTIAKRAAGGAVKKSSIKKSATRKAAVKKTVARKAKVKKVAARKPAARKAARKVAIKKTSARKAAARKPRMTARARAIAELQQVRGIGEKYAEKLYRGGIKSLEALGGLLKKDALELSARIGLGRRIYSEKWPAQARKLARRQAKAKAARGK